MKALIVLENHFFLDNNNNVWCDRVVDYNYLKRYLSTFESIIVTGRTQFVSNIYDTKILVNGPNVEFYALPDFKGAKGLLLNLLKIRKSIKKIISKCDCAIYRAPTHLSLFTYKEVIKAKKPLALEFMMAADKMFEGNGIIKKVLNKIVDKKAKKMCLAVNGVSYVTKNILQKKYPCKAILYPEKKKYFTGNYSSIDLPIEDYFKQNWKESNPPKIFKIIHIGYMDSYRKGQDVLIKALKIVLDKGYNVTLTFIGDGEKRKEFESLTKTLNINSKVEFIGLIKSKKEILNYLRKSHLMVFPTKSEGLPRTIIEAMSQGLPCISSPVDGIPELLNDEFLIDYDDVNGYANKIIEMINNWDKCCTISKENYNKSLKYNKKYLKQKRDDFYTRLVVIGGNK